MKRLVGVVAVLAACAEGQVAPADAAIDQPAPLDSAAPLDQPAPADRPTPLDRPAPLDVPTPDVSVVTPDVPVDVPAVVDAGDPSRGRLGALSRDGDTVTLRTHPTVNYRGVDAAYDPERRVFLAVYGNGPIGGALLDDEGRQVGDGFRLTDAPFGEGSWTQLPRVAYGGGAFMVTWHLEAPGGVRVQARRVRVSADGASPEFDGPAVTVSPPGSKQESPAALAWSPSSREFLAVWARQGVKARRLSAAGEPLGEVVALSEEGVWAEQPSVVAHPSGGYFVAYMQESAGSARVALARVEDGTARVTSTRDLTGPIAFAKVTDVALDADRGEVIASWYEVRGGVSGFAAQRFAADGSPRSERTLIFAPHGSYDGYDLAWSPATGTALGVFHGPAAEVFGAELDVGLANRAPEVLTMSGARNGLYLPRAVAHPTRPWWLVFGSADYARVTVQRVRRGP